MQEGFADFQWFWTNVFVYFAVELMKGGDTTTKPNYILSTFITVPVFFLNLFCSENLQSYSTGNLRYNVTSSFQLFWLFLLLFLDDHIIRSESGPIFNFFSSDFEQ